MEYLFGGLFVLAVLACAAVGAWVIFAWFFGGAAGSKPRIRFDYCPGCDLQLRPGEHVCPDCGLDLTSRLAGRLDRVRVAGEEVSDLLARGELDLSTTRQVKKLLNHRRHQLLYPPARPIPSEAPAQPTEVSRAHPPPAEPPEDVSRDSIGPPTPPVRPKPVKPPRRSVAAMLSDFMHERNILWGELVGGLLIVGCSIALVLSLWQSLEELPYFPFLLSAAITAALFGAGEYAFHYWKLSATSRGLLVIALLLTPLNLLLLTDPGVRGAVGWLDVAVKLVAVGIFTLLVRTAARDVFGDALPGPAGGRWMLALAVVGASAVQLVPLGEGVPGTLRVWGALACTVVAAGLVLWAVADRRSGTRLGDATASALLMFVGLSTFALFASWGAGLARVGDLTTALPGLALPLILAAVPAVAAGLTVHRRLLRPVGLRVTGTGVALAGVAAMLSALVLAWPHPLALLSASLTAGAILTGFAVRYRFAWLHLAALPNLGLAALLGYHGLVEGWATPAGAAPGSWLAGRLTDAGSGGVLAVFALLLAAVAELLTRLRRWADARAYAVGGTVAAVTALFVASVRGPDAPFTAAIVHALCAAGFILASWRWRYRLVSEVGVWLILPATLWLLWGVWPDSRDRWGLIVGLEAVVLASVAWVLGRLRGGEPGVSLRQLQGATANGAAAAAVLALGLGLTVLDRPHSAAHTGTLLTVALAILLLADVFAKRWVTWAGSLVGLLGLLHLTTYAIELRPVRLAVLVALVGHSVFAIVGALSFCGRGLRDRLFAGPLKLAGSLTSALAIPLFFVPDPQSALAWAGLAVGVGVVWLVLALAWRVPGGFPAFQFALTAAAVFVALAWVARQPWVEVSRFGYGDPRALQAYGLAVALLGLGWIVARHLLRRSEAVQVLWPGGWPAVDRVAIGAVVVGQLALAVVGILPAMVAEITPPGSPGPTSPLVLAESWGPGAWVLAAVLTVVLVAGLRLAPAGDRGDASLVGLTILALTVPVLAAGSFAPALAAASALRWGLAAAFLIGTAAIACRRPIRRVTRRATLPVPGRQATRVSRRLLAVAAFVVVLLTAATATVGLTGQIPSGPAVGSFFDRMGWTASTVVPLVAVVIGLAWMALRERSSGYALAGAAVFTATPSGGYALGVVTGGGTIGSVELVWVGLLAAGAAAVWCLLWLAVEWRVPGDGLLAGVVVAGQAGVAALAAVPLGLLLIDPGRPLGPASVVLGRFGWTALSLSTAAAFWYAVRSAPRFRFSALGWAGLVAGVLAGSVFAPWDSPGEWLSYHALAVGWAVVGVALVGFLVWPTPNDDRARSETVWPALIALGIAGLALRGGWDDPHRPLAPAGMAIWAALLVGTMAVRFGGQARIYLSGTLLTFAAVLVWAEWGPQTAAGFALATAVGLGLAASIWTAAGQVVDTVRLRGSGDAAAWPGFPAAASWVSLGLLLIGLAPTLAGERTEPFGLGWGATATLGIAFLAGSLSRETRRAAAGLYLLGCAAALYAVAGFHPGPVWAAWPTPVVLAGFAVAAAAAGWAADRLRPVEVGLTERWAWFGPAQLGLGLVALSLAVAAGLREPELVVRLCGPLAVALLAPALLIGNRTAPGRWRELVRPVALGLCVAAAGLVGWAVPDPPGPAVWLQRNAWLFVALAVTAAVGLELIPRLGVGPVWARDARRVGGATAGLAVVVALVLVAQQITAFDPITRRTPLGTAAVWSTLACLALLAALGIRLALRSDGEPLPLSERGRTGYVYLAELQVVLLFVGLRLNVPELFFGQAVRYWTFIVMALAFVGVGSAEVFARRGVRVLAVPLRRTGVLLPLIPLLAFWARPPGLLLAYADDRAPGLRPMIRYLENLPQHYDSYAVLWLMAGAIYAVLALTRWSYGWALLAALATNAALWALLAHHEVPAAVHPQAWVIPLALIVLVSEHIHRGRLRPETSAGLRYLGVAMIYVSSAADLFIAGVGQSLWLPVILAVLCAAGVLAGVMLRVRAFLFLGLGFLFLDVFAMIWHAAVDRAQTWVWYASGIVLGAAILALFAVLEQRRDAATGLVDRLRRWD